MFSCLHFEISSDLLFKERSLFAMKISNFSAKHKSSRDPKKMSNGKIHNGMIALYSNVQFLGSREEANCLLTPCAHLFQRFGQLFVDSAHNQCEWIPQSQGQQLFKRH